MPHALTYPAVVLFGHCTARVIAEIIAGQGDRFPYAVGSPSCVEFNKNDVYAKNAHDMSTYSLVQYWQKISM